MKRSLTLSILLLVFICGGVFAQSQNITWTMGVYKYLSGSDYQDYSPQRSSISMESGDEFYIYLKADTPGYYYIVKENTDRTSSFHFGGYLTAGEAKLILEDDEDFIVPAGTGVIRFQVVVSSSQIPKLEQYWNQGAGRNFSGAQHTALIDEITTVRNSTSTVAEAPEKPVVIAGAVRGKTSTAYQYEVRGTYVRTIFIRY